MGFSAFVLAELTRFLSKAKISYNNWSHLADLDLADPDCADPSKVYCILGANIYSTINLNGLIKGPTGTPVALQSVFGCDILAFYTRLTFRRLSIPPWY